MSSPLDSDQEKLTKELAEALKEKLEKPEWASYVKTGMGKERLPDDPDWWFYRAASVMKRLYKDGPVGVSKLRSYYGNKHRRGHKPARFAKGGGKIIRAILQDLEKASLAKKTEKPKGRALTPEGMKLLNKVAKSLK
ncbi:MAG: 30S ribosomal protein S19e [Candidatus Aenigmarchaeota archaeon]|nr:30S ribosomal protein S19e [Candidatus Aenigmarchaeota archaeon]